MPTNRTPNHDPRIFKSDLNSDRVADRYGIDSAPSPADFKAADVDEKAPTEEHFPEIDPQAERSPDGAFDRFGRRTGVSGVDAARVEPGRPAADHAADHAMERPLHPQQRQAPPRIPESELTRDEAIARQRQIDEEARIDRHADRQKQVQLDKENQTSKR